MGDLVQAMDPDTLEVSLGHHVTHGLLCASSRDSLGPGPEAVPRRLFTVAREGGAPPSSYPASRRVSDRQAQRTVGWEGRGLAGCQGKGTDERESRVEVVLPTHASQTQQARRGGGPVHGGRLRGRGPQRSSFSGRPWQLIETYNHPEAAMSL